MIRSVPIRPDSPSSSIWQSLQCWRFWSACCFPRSRKPSRRPIGPASACRLKRRNSSPASRRCRSIRNRMTASRTTRFSMPEEPALHVLHQRVRLDTAKGVARRDPKMTANRRSLIVLILLFGMTRACKGDGDVELFHSFDATAGHPSGTLIRASDGAFHGTTKSGGMHGRGSVYRIEADRKLVTLHSFDGTNGGAPVAPLFQASNGLLYGSTSEGGQRNLGTLFRLPLTGPVQTLVHFGGWTNGGSPRAGLFQAK